jgi:hypothetical protein
MEEPIKGGTKGCLNCGRVEDCLPMDGMLAVGFGSVTVTNSKRVVWSGDDPNKTVKEIEAMAQKEPDDNWRIRFDSPLWSGVYQRHGKEKWCLIEQGMGFA